MSFVNLFGEEELTKEEKEKVAQEERIKKEKEAKFKNIKKETLSKLKKLPKAEVLSVQEQIEDAKTAEEIESIWTPFEGRYNEIVNKEKEIEEKANKNKKYKYPFLMYFGHEYRDVTGVFEEGKEYTGKELVSELINHGFKDFKYAQEIEWEYFEDENCLYPKFKLGNRG